MARSRIATGANGQNGGYRNHPFPTQLPRNAGTVKAQRASPSVPSVTSCSKNPKLHRPGPASLGGLRASAVQISSQRHRRSQSDATSHSKSKIQHSKSLFFRVPWRPPRLGGSSHKPAWSERSGGEIHLTGSQQSVHIYVCERQLNYRMACFAKSRHWPSRKV
jgi:hypothetical protein